MPFRFGRRWLAAAALSAAACLSPTLPLPPPSAPSVSGTDSEGLVHLTGTVEPESEVFALNYRTNVISGQLTHSGQYDFTIPAVQYDELSIWYLQGTLASPTTEFSVKKAPGEP